ncbi:MFS transporter [Ciceribacter sp. L1K22]|uniref:MFS transporter n=1 Tax=Ciceribacter sp. L1K22 TaxID=2820275 RepID=UPI001ABE7F50|nr:MFS transporter [Ciceribacter sp. L1K22]MBO3762578.1 MFS transporter [Ciceribacter sp. L1K22]
MRLTYWLLFAVYAANYLDRQIFGILLEPIREDLALGDLEMGLLSGLAFAVAFGLAALPASLLAAVGNRRNLVAASAVLWGVITTASGLATSFVQLFLARSALAVAEAVSVPASHSILSDAAETGSRIRRFGHYTSGAAVGGLLAVFVGGVVGERWGWRIAMVVAGIIALLPALLLFLVSEPRRDYVALDRERRFSGVFATVARTVWRDRRARLAFLAKALNQIVLAGAAAWYPAFLIREHGFTQVQSATLVAFGGLVAIIGTIVSSRVIAKLATGNRVWLVRGPAIIIICSKPFSLVFLTADHPLLMLAAYAVPATLALATFPPTISLLHEIVRPAERPVVSAMLTSVMTVVGLGLGPTAVGLISAAIGGTSSLSIALIALHGFGLVAALLYWHAEPSAAVRGASATPG